MSGGWIEVIYAHECSTSPLTVALNKGGYGGYPLVDVWVTDVEDDKVDFLIYGSCTGEDGTWRLLETLETKASTPEQHTSFATSYNFIRVVNESETQSEIEIVAGEGG